MAFPHQRSPIPPGERLAGKYRVEREIGAGAMGVVVEAWHIELDQRVAIKFLNPEFASNEEVAERFRREARAAVRIESEHVARVIDIGLLEEGRTPYYVMEFLPGNDLSRELAQRGPLPVTVAVDYVLQACEALSEAHGKGIVHRDLKPANLFLAQRPNGGRMIKVLDFGISKFTGTSSRQFSLTDTSTLMGSPAYMSPEQLESSRNVDGRADIWSLGVILHELILGQIPFRGDSVLQLVRAILAGARTPLTARAEVPQGLEDVVARCLKQEREQRFASIDELREALAPFSSSAPASVVVSTSRGVAPELRAPTSGTPAMSAPAPGARAEPHARSASTSWGNTQRARAWHTVYRRALPGVLLAALLLGGGYFAIRAWRVKPGAPAVAAQPLPPPPATTAQAEPPRPASSAPDPAPTASAPPAVVLVPPPAAPRHDTDAPASRLDPPPVAPPPRAPVTAAPSRQPAGAETKPAQSARPTGTAALGGEPKASNSEEPAKAADAPHIQTPTPRGLDIPDYGGRE